jgi:RimJ/RimL family protein N-acetyltransferase
MDKLTQTYTFTDGPHMGRWGSAPRKGYILTPKHSKNSKKAKKRKLFLKEIDLSTKKFRKEYKTEAKVNAKCTTSFPTKCIDTWIEQKKGYILSQYMEHISWEDLPKKHKQRAATNLVKQLQHIHKCKFSQGDLAPKNLMVDKKGNTSIVDFEDAATLTPKSKQRDWDELRHTFFPYGPYQPQDTHMFNHIQHAIPNDGYVLELDARQHGESKKGHAFVMMHKKKRIGRVFLLRRTSGIWKQWTYVSNVIVYPQFRHKGMCTKMIQLLRNFAHTRMYLKVDSENKAAIGCYTKAGFSINPKKSTKKTFVMTSIQ